ncbi:Elicitin-like protein [Globisporangium polare]
MNALRVAIVTIGAVLLSSSVQQADATSCELMKIFAAVKPLESNTDVVACIAATGYEMLPPSGAPTDAQMAKLCGTSACQSVFTALQKMDIPDCTIDILGGLNVKQTFAAIITKCGGPVTGGSTSTSSSSTTSTVTKSTTQASQPLAAATPAPSATAAGTSSSAPAATTTPPATANGDASDTPSMTASPVPATTSAPAATPAPAKANAVTTSAPATMVPSAKATTATSTPASSTTTPTTAPSKTGASNAAVHAPAEPALEPQMCV